MQLIRIFRKKKKGKEKRCIMNFKHAALTKLRKLPLSTFEIIFAILFSERVLAQPACTFIVPFAQFKSHDDTIFVSSEHCLRRDAAFHCSSSPLTDRTDKWKKKTESTTKRVCLTQNRSIENENNKDSIKQVKKNVQRGFRTSSYVCTLQRYNDLSSNQN